MQMRRMSVGSQAMQTATLGPLTVSRLALGTMLMGDATPVDDAHRILDRFVDAGGTLVDTADTYGDGESERVLAPWLARRPDDVVLATKVRFATARPPGGWLSAARIRAACDASLRRLGVDHIDLYQVHAPDPDVPLEETLEALDGAGRRGTGRARRAGARRQGARSRRLELPGLAAGVGGRAAGPPWLVAVRLAAAAVLAGRAPDRDRAAAVLPRCRAGGDPVGAAGRRLPDRPLLPRRTAARGLADGRRVR